MPLLETLSIRNCAGLSANINLRDCPEITTVDTTGTTIDVSLPIGTKIQTLTLGDPEYIYLEDPTRITASGITVVDNSHIDSIELINIPIAANGNSGGFNVFGKIMNL